MKLVTQQDLNKISSVSPGANYVINRNLTGGNVLVPVQVAVPVATGSTQSPFIFAQIRGSPLSNNKYPISIPVDGSTPIQATAYIPKYMPARFLSISAWVTLPRTALV